MTADIREHLRARPFEPFTVLTSAGTRYDVVSPDHADVNPAGTRIVIWFDDDSSVTIAGLHVAAIETRTASQSG